MVPRTPTPTLIAALRILASEIQSPDGVANAAIAEAADRLEEIEKAISREKKISEIRGDFMNRLPFCPDHRDKVKGSPCRECRIERLENGLQSIVSHQDATLRSMAEYSAVTRIAKAVLKK